jgi:hypothetical protein
MDSAGNPRSSYLPHLWVLIYVVLLLSSLDYDPPII